LIDLPQYKNMKTFLDLLEIQSFKQQLGRIDNELNCKIHLSWLCLSKEIVSSKLINFENIYFNCDLITFYLPQLKDLYQMLESLPF